MSRADLHLHSRYCVSSSEYLVRMMQLNESYTGIETLYARAKRLARRWRRDARAAGGRR